MIVVGNVILQAGADSVVTLRVYRWRLNYKRVPNSTQPISGVYSLMSFLHRVERRFRLLVS